MDEHSSISITRFGSDRTLRLSCREGDLLIWFRWTSVLAEHLEVIDVWEMRAGDYATITNRWNDLPSWFELHPTEVCDRLIRSMQARIENGDIPDEVMEGPNLWRARAGDRLVWMGPPRTGVPAHGNVLGVIDFTESALVAGETNRTQTAAGEWLFGALTPEGTRPENVARGREAVAVVRAMGIPRTLATAWRLG